MLKRIDSYIIFTVLCLFISIYLFDLNISYPHSLVLAFLGFIWFFCVWIVTIIFFIASCKSWIRDKKISRLIAAGTTIVCSIIGLMII